MTDRITNEKNGEGLHTSNLNVGYESDVVKDISLAVSPGKIVTLIGPNGSGKSTILKTVAGLLEPRGGVIMLDGLSKADIGSKEASKILAAVMTGRINPELMTCKDVIESGRYPYTGLFGKLSEEDVRKVDEAMAATDTMDIADRDFRNISDGQRQRVLLARAIAQDPGVLILDEPTSFLDIRYKIDILTRIRKLASEKNIAVLMSLHEPEIAMKLSDTVVAVGDGKVLRMGTVDEVFTERFIRELFKLGDMDVRLLGKLWYADGGSPYYSNARHTYCSSDRGSRSRHIMVMGTMSNVGKSVVVAALCRIFARDGYKVAPFKSQNMANNSFVTADGLEMGRAQVMQAVCAGAEPDVRMNPILLKPTDECGSQVVVMGKPVANMRAAEYFEYKKSLVPTIKAAYESLSSEYDIIVIEGAGSPAEINLRDNDIVNMGLAEMLDAPVLLVGDIDRGGVFAQLIGTLDLLEKNERDRVKGLVINKFRGDAALLAPGIDILKEKAKCDVTGVIPFMDLNIDDEDSLSDRFTRREPKEFDIVVIRLPHIANYTDFDVFEESDDISVRYENMPGRIGKPDMLIIPGTKNTAGDLKWLKTSGIADSIVKLAAEEVPVFGICGGYQMLGRNISDPDGAEGGISETGLELLPVDTVMNSSKTRKSFAGRICEPTGVLSHLGGREIKGYEIHMGQTEPFDRVFEFTSEGSGYCRGNIYGTYVHGLFDENMVAADIVRTVSELNKKSVDISALSDRTGYKQSQYDLLADTVRKSLDMDAIYRMIGYNDKR
ncbi:MAG: cobyric acid synthase [Lachnospiraceae bacterium]|nr:cobyric acid synthase [Lachnospiraceae bacterium]